MRLLVIAVFVFLAVPSLAIADCPMNHYGAGQYGHAIQYDSTEPAKSYEGTPVVPGASCIACYSWPSGYFRVSGEAPSDWGSFVSAEDQFQIVGPSSATPISFTVRLRVTGSLDVYASGSAGIEDLSGGSAVQNFSGGQTPSNLLVTLAVQHLPDEPFNLKVDLSVGSGYPYTSGDLQAYLEFVDVPHAWSVISCQGYDVPVPTQAETWGRVRALYR